MAEIFTDYNCFFNNDGILYIITNPHNFQSQPNNQTEIIKWDGEFPGDDDEPKSKSKPIPLINSDNLRSPSSVKQISLPKLTRTASIQPSLSTIRPRPESDSESNTESDSDESLPETPQLVRENTIRTILNVPIDPDQALIAQLLLEDMVD